MADEDDIVASGVQESDEGEGYGWFDEGGPILEGEFVEGDVALARGKDFRAGMLLFGG